MISLFRSGSKLASTSAFAIAAFSLLSCGGSGTGEAEGWAPNSPTGYFFRIDTNTGTNSGNIPGLIQINFTSDNQGNVSAPNTITQSFNVPGTPTYIRTGKNSFTISFNIIKYPGAPPSSTTIFKADCVLDSYDNDRKYAQGTVKWYYNGWKILSATSPESGEGSGASIEVGFNSSLNN